MRCLICQQPFQTQRTLCMRCAVKHTGICIHCGPPIPAEAVLCPSCRATQSSITTAEPFQSGTPPLANVRLPSLGVPEVDAALAWSWLIDMGQGNFLAARNAAEQALQQARTAHTLCARAVVHVLQGEFVAAFPLFEEAFHISQDAEYRFLIACLARWAEYLRGNVLPDGFSIVFTESVLRWNHYVTNSLWEQRCETHSNQLSTPLMKVTGAFLRQVLMNLPSYRVQFINVNKKNPDRVWVVKYAFEKIDPLLAFAKKWGPHGLQMWLLLARADLLALDGQIDQAASCYTELRQHFHAHNHMPGMALCFLRMGDLLAMAHGRGSPLLFGYRLTNEPAPPTTTPDDPQFFARPGIAVDFARGWYTLAKERFTIAGMPRGTAQAHVRLAYLDALEEKWTEAAENYQQARQLFEERGDILGVQAAAFGSIWLRWRQKEPGLEIALRPLIQRISANEALACGLGWGLAFAYAGREAFLLHGDIEAALSAATLAETIFATLHVPSYCVLTCGDRSAALQTLEATEASFMETENALNWFVQMSTQAKDEMSYELRISGLTLMQQLIHTFSPQFDAQGLECARSLIPTLIAAVPQATIADVKAAKRRLPFGLFQALLQGKEQAIEQLGDVISRCALYEMARMLEGQLAFQIPLAHGTCAMEHDDEVTAAIFFEQALTAADTVPERDFYKAMVYTAWRRYMEARKHLRRYVAAGMPGGEEPLHRLRKELRLFGHDKQGIKVDEQEQKVRNHELVAGFFISMRAWQDARLHYAEVTRTAGPPAPLQKLPTIGEIVRCADEGAIAEGLGEHEQALSYFQEAANGLEARRRSLLSETWRRAMGGQRRTLNIYGPWVRTLADMGKWQEAFEVIERAHARVLTEAVNAASIVQSEGKVGELLQSYKECLARVERLTSQLAIARKTAERDQHALTTLQEQREQAFNEQTACEGKLFQADPRWQEMLAPQTAMLSVAEVAARLPSGSLLLAYFFYDESMLIWAVSERGLVAHFSTKEFAGKPFIARSFAAKAQQWVQTLSKKAEYDPQFGSDFANVLVEPFTTFIEEATNLVIVPFAELTMLPFHVLPWHGQPLGLQKPCTYLPAASLLQYLRSQPYGTRNTLVIGDPEAMSLPDVQAGAVTPPPSLPAARIEAELVAAIYSTSPLIGSQATKDAVSRELEKKPGVIHLATHGYLQPGVPFASGIALAAGTMLTAEEIIGMQLNADIVVLSACETGKGELQGSELIGLVRSLMYAGVRSTIVSLWNAKDIATAPLMDHLHQQLHAGVPPALALQRAMRHVYHMAAQQALDFYTTALANHTSHSNTDEAVYAELLCAKGDVLVQARDYAGAGEAYREAQKKFKLIGNVKRARQVQADYDRALFAQGKSNFQPDKLIFQAARYWAAFEVIGAWQ
ncbi:MAG: CHAT domain-containing protein [Ktedonobacteraceae bacterium]